MEQLNYNQLYYFWRVAREGGFTAAARRLFTTQSNLSLHVRRLEKFMGKTLFTRGRRGVRPTPGGELLLEYADRIFRPAEGLRDRVRRDVSPPPVPLLLGFSTGLSTAILSELQRFMARSHPEILLRFLSGAPEDLREMLARHQIDLAASNADVSHGVGPELRARWVGSIPLYFVAAPSLAGKVRRFPQDLNRVPFLLRLPDHPTRKEVDLYFYKGGMTPRIVLEAENADALRTLALEGAGVAVLDALTLGSLKGSLHRLHPRPLPFFENLWLIHHRAPISESSLQSARDHLAEKFSLPPFHPEK